MAVLSRRFIEERLRLPVTDDKSLVITPFLNPTEALDVDAIDVRLGSYFLIPKASSVTELDPALAISESMYTRVHVPYDKDHYLVLSAHQTILGATMEFIKLPHDTSGQIWTKSSVARMFMVIETAPWIHPFYRGCLTLEIANVSSTALKIYPGMPIGQLVLMDTPGAEVPEKIKTSYFGPVYPEPPRFGNFKAKLPNVKAPI